MESVRSLCSLEIGSFIERKVSTALAIPRLPSAFSKSIGYETLKNLTRTGAAIDEKTIEDFISTLDVADSVKEELRAITPWNYTGF